MGQWAGIGLPLTPSSSLKTFFASFFCPESGTSVCIQRPRATEKATSSCSNSHPGCLLCTMILLPARSLSAENTHQHRRMLEGTFTKFKVGDSW